jgi:hypothetical protein
MTGVGAGAYGVGADGGGSGCCAPGVAAYGSSPRAGGS